MAGWALGRDHGNQIGVRDNVKTRRCRTEGHAGGRGQTLTLGFRRIE